MDPIDRIPKIVTRAPLPSAPAAPAQAAAPTDAFQPTVVSPFAPSTPRLAAAPAAAPTFASAAAASEVSRSTASRMLGLAGLALLAIGGLTAVNAQAQTPPQFPTVPSVPLPFGQPGQMQPSGPKESFDDFIARMRAAKQHAQQQAPPQQAQPGQGARDQTRTNVGVTVTAHSFYSGNKLVGVTNIRIAESGNYSNRTTQSYTTYSGSSTQALRLDTGHPGKYYNVYVTWADGSSQTYGVRADGSGGRVDAWKY